MPVSGAEPPGAMAVGTEVKQPKPKAFEAFEAYVNGNANRLNNLIKGIGKNGSDKGSDSTFWDNSPIDREDTDHFLGDWLGHGYWAGDPDSNGARLYKKLRKGVRDGAIAAQKLSKPLAMDLWVDSSASTVKVKVDSAKSLPAVTIRVITPKV